MKRLIAYLKYFWPRNSHIETLEESTGAKDVIHHSVRELRYLEPEVFEAIAMPITRLNISHPQYHLNLRNGHRSPDDPGSNLEKPLPAVPKLVGIAQNNPQWHPWLFLTTTPTHPRAMKALSKRYEDKFASWFDVSKYPGLGVGGLENRVMSLADLEARVLYDIAWIRNRYQHAGLDEPSDSDIIWWYDAERYDVEAGAAGESREASDIENRNQFLAGFMHGNLQFSKSTPS